MCVALARAGADAVREGGPRTFRSKASELDLVTDADERSEAAIIALLRRERAQDSVLSEERGLVQGSTEYRWLVDPIDGTRNFARDIPFYCVSVAVSNAEGVVAGAVEDIPHRETFSAARGAGAWLCENSGGERRLFAEARAGGISSALVATGFSPHRSRRRRELAYVAEVASVAGELRAGGATALELCWVAAGRTDGYFEGGLEIWDWAAGALIAVEAGAWVGGIDGGPPSDAMVIAGRDEVGAELRAALARTAVAD
jgi:myo-inositol-1(or 4)-monophosphatase